MVRYYDDNGILHLIYISEEWEFNFLKERFNNIELILPY